MHQPQAFTNHLAGQVAPPPWYAWCAEKAGQEGTGEAKNPRGVRTVSTGVDATSAEASVPEAGSLWREKS